MKSLFSFFRRQHLSSGGADSAIAQKALDEHRSDNAAGPKPPLGDATLGKARGQSRDGQTEPSVATSGLDSASIARAFPSSGYELIDASVKLEEEVYSWYSAKTFYPAEIGQMLHGSYQVIAKLGYGAASTAWLCRDLRKHCYVVVKIYAREDVQTGREIAALEHLQSILTASPRVRHIGVNNVRTLLDRFEVVHPRTSKKNLCLVFTPLGLSLGDARKLLFGGRLDPASAKEVLVHILLGLDFLHQKAKLVHADLREDNILLNLDDLDDLLQLEKNEMEHPSPRKVYKDHTIYTTRPVVAAGSTPIICDFGEARFGKDSYTEEVLPDLYRSPEILLRLAWDEKIDIWTLGLVLWTMIEGTNLFTDNKGGRDKSAITHMVRMISLLGPPPQEMLDQSHISKDYFDKHGSLRKGYKIVETSLEAEATALEGDEKNGFLGFLRRCLQWEAGKRPSARELLNDPWFALKSDSASEDE